MFICLGVSGQSSGAIRTRQLMKPQKPGGYILLYNRLCGFQL